MNSLPTKAIFLIALLFLGAGCKGQQDDGTKPFQGEWTFLDASEKPTNKIAKFERDVVQVSDEKSDAMLNSEMLKDGIAKSSIQIDAKKSPAQIDFVALEGDDQGKTRPAIFSFEGNRLKLCIAAYGGPRPADFVPRSEVKVLLLEKKSK